MVASALLTVLGLVLVVVQVAFSDGARPNVVSLPIGMVPITIAMILLLVGPFIGLATGNARFRLASALALAGSATFAAGVMLLGGDGRPLMLVGTALWLLAIVLGTAGLLGGRGEPDPAH
jgi:hypothetical protein